MGHTQFCEGILPQLVMCDLASIPSGQYSNKNLANYYSTPNLSVNS